jgi:predicted RNA-binding Zn-ribbon protein involved in translation (DUF1610 family)
MNLSDARLCIDCEEVFNSGQTVCPKCAGKSSALIANWLNREHKLESTRTPLKCRCFLCENTFESFNGESLYFCPECSKFEVWRSI